MIIFSSPPFTIASQSDISLILRLFGLYHYQKMGILGEIVRKPDEIYPLLKLKMAVKKAKKQVPPEPHWGFCYSTLHKVSKSFSLVIQQLGTELRNAVCFLPPSLSLNRYYYMLVLVCTWSMKYVYKVTFLKNINFIYILHICFLESNSSLYICLFSFCNTTVF